MRRHDSQLLDAWIASGASVRQHPSEAAKAELGESSGVILEAAGSQVYLRGTRNAQRSLCITRVLQQPSGVAQAQAGRGEAAHAGIPETRAHGEARHACVDVLIDLLDRERKRMAAQAVVRVLGTSSEVVDCHLIRKIRGAEGETAEKRKLDRSSFEARILREHIFTMTSLQLGDSMLFFEPSCLIAGRESLENLVVPLLRRSDGGPSLEARSTETGRRLQA